MPRTENNSQDQILSPKIFALEMMNVILNTRITYWDVESILKNIGSDWQKWIPEWTKAADRYRALAQEAERSGKLASMKQWYLIASALYHFADNFFPKPSVAVLDTDGKLNARKASIESYEKIAPFLEPAATKVAILYKDKSLPGYLRMPMNSPEAVPAVLLITGLDSAKEVELHNLGNYFLERGMATLVFDGPGQGEVWFTLKAASQYEEAISACIDWISNQPGINPQALGLVGEDAGGYWALRAGATDKRIKTCLAVGSPFDFQAWVTKSEMDLRARAKFTFGIETDEELRQRTEGESLANVPAIAVPLLIIHSQKDKVVPIQETEKIIAWAKGPKDYWLLEDSGQVVERAGEIYPKLADWMQEKLEE